MRRGIVVGLLGSITVATLVAGSLLAQGVREPDSTLPHGFQQRYVVLETKDKVFTVLELPQLRMLGNRVYLVGKAPAEASGIGVGSFSKITQWVCLDDVRRMGEVQSQSELKSVIEEELFLRRDEEARRAQGLK